MPYITQEERLKVNPEIDRMVDLIQQNNWNVGLINYIFSTILWTWFKQVPSYPTINGIVGVLGCVKDEFYKRIASPYENIKKEINGDLHVAPKAWDKWTHDGK